MTRDVGRAHEAIDALVYRFLAWPLPPSVCSDLCVTSAGYRFPRSGTNLLTADEARQMIEHLLAAPAASGTSSMLDISALSIMHSITLRVRLMALLSLRIRMATTIMRLAAWLAGFQIDVSIDKDQPAA